MTKKLAKGVFRTTKKGQKVFIAFEKKHPQGKGISKKQMKTIHAKKNYVGVAIIKNPKDREGEIFISKKPPTTESEAFHSAARKSREEIDDKRFKIGAIRLGIALKKSEIKDLREKDTLPKTASGNNAFVVAEKERAGQEKLLARVPPKDDKLDTTIVVDREFFKKNRRKGK